MYCMYKIVRKINFKSSIIIIIIIIIIITIIIMTCFWYVVAFIGITTLFSEKTS